MEQSESRDSTPDLPSVSLVVAVAENGVIGAGGDLPWRLPADLQHFKKLTSGHTVVMGRKTFESIGRPLPNRRSIVLTRQAGWTHEGVEVARGLDEALAMVAGEREVFVIGGEAVFSEALAVARRVHLTRVHAEVAGDTYFPAMKEGAWQVVSRERRQADATNAHAMSFLVYERASR